MTPHRGMLVEFYASDVVHIVIDVRGDICTVARSNYRAASQLYEVHKSLCTKFSDEKGDVIYETV